MTLFPLYDKEMYYSAYSYTCNHNVGNGITLGHLRASGMGYDCVYFFFYNTGRFTYHGPANIYEDFFSKIGFALD